MGVTHPSKKLTVLFWLNAGFDSQLCATEFWLLIS